MRLMRVASTGITRASSVAVCSLSRQYQRRVYSLLVMPWGATSSSIDLSSMLNSSLICVPRLGTASSAQR